MELVLVPDSTIVYQWILFMIVVVALNFCIFQPALRILEERKRRTSGATDTSRDLHIKADQLLKQCEDKIELARSLSLKKREQLLDESSKQRDLLVKEARSSADKRIAEVRAQIQTEASQAAIELKSEIKKIGHGVASHLLDREIVS